MPLVVIRDGSSGFSFVGETSMSEEVIVDKVLQGGMIKLTNARIMQTFLMSIGPGAIAQDTHIFPLDSELGPADPWVRPTSFYFPSEEACKRIKNLTERCTDNEKKLHARESGLAV